MSETRKKDQPVDKGYEPPRLRRLGTLAELTKGGVEGPDDGLGGGGFS
ncbi:lasso RiPP family leader peptide-containing protein [Micromonospora sp. FIMYZ51]